MKRMCICMLCFMLCVGWIVPAAHAQTSISAQSAALYDPLTETFLYEKNADTRRLIASTTKIVTALIVLEMADPDSEVTIRPEYLRTEGSSMYLRSGEVITIRELLYGLLMMSGNDAALTLAYVCGDGDPQLFVDRMNALAEELGLEDTSFTNPHGLDHEMHYSTAKDLARLTAYAMKNEMFREIVSTKTYATDTRSMRNHNKLLWRGEGIVGVKTGFTKKAGRCLVSVCERDGRLLIAVTLHAPSDWNDHMCLYEDAYGMMQDYTMCTGGETAFVMPVVSGHSTAVNVVYGETCTLKLSDSQARHVRVVFRTPQFVYAPVEKNSAVGYAEFELHGAVLASVPLYYAKTVENLQDESNGFFAKLRMIFDAYFA